MPKIELLAPAGNIERLKTAFLYGADACYIGGKKYNLRANAKNFTDEQIKEAVEIAHLQGKKIYVTVNMVFNNQDEEGLIEYLKYLSLIKVDAIIISDIFITDILKENNIELETHLSTQASTSNYEAINFYKNLGIKRIVLSREQSRENIKEIIDKTGTDVEVFVHGAMCSSYSGRCALSNYFTKRDANRGGCAQVCRWEFDLYDQNKKRIETKTRFTCAPKDLSMITNLKDMIDIGIASLKVEGRMRSDYYVATVINTYRNAIDDYYNNKLDEYKIEYYNKILTRVANRDNKAQFYNSFPTVEEQYYLGRQEESNQDFLGIVLSYNDQTKEVVLEERNYFKPGDVCEFFGPNIKAFTIVIPSIYDEDNNKIDAARHPKQIIKFKLDKKVYQYDILRIKI